MPILHVRITEDLAEWLEQKCPARGDASKLVRQLLTAEQMKEAVAPLVPDGEVRFFKDSDDDIPWAMPLAAEEVLAAGHAVGGRMPTLNEFDAYKAEPKPKARRKNRIGNVKGSPATVKGLSSTIAQGDGTPQTGDVVPESPSTLLPDRCNRGACTGTIKPNGRCIRCNQEPQRVV